MENKKIDYVAKKYPYTTLMTWEFYEHRHSFWEFVVCTKGESYHYVNEVKYPIKAGDVLIMKPDSIHDYKLLNKDNYSHYDFYSSIVDMKAVCGHFHQSLYQNITKEATPIIFNADIATLNMLEAKMAKLNTLQLEPKFEKMTLSVYSTMLHLFCGLIVENYEQQQNNMPDWLSELLSQMSRPEILTGSLENIVSISNFSHGHLCKLFKKHMGETLTAYFTKLKLDYSTVLLKNKDMNVLDIALYLGYDSVSHFISLFKKFNGITPKQYRRTFAT